MTLPPMDLVAWYAKRNRTVYAPVNDPGLMARIQEQVDARLPDLTWLPDDGQPLLLDTSLDLSARSITDIYPEASDG